MLKNISSIFHRNEDNEDGRWMKPLEGFDTYSLDEYSDNRVTVIFCIICVIVFVLDKLSGGALTVLGIKDNRAIIEYGQYYRLLSCTLLHLGLVHIISNIIFIKGYGKNCEYLFGHLKLTGVFIMAGLSGSLYSLALSPERSVGASGIAFGLAGALLSVKYAIPDEMKKIATKSIFQVVLINVIVGLITPGIDNAAHIGGFIGGYFCGLGFGARKEIGRRKTRVFGWLMYIICCIAPFIISSRYGYPDLSIKSIFNLIISWL